MKHLVDWGPGFRFFECEECGTKWKEPSRDCTSPSGEACLECGEFVSPNGHEKHYEWKTHYGNLIRGERYE